MSPLYFGDEQTPIERVEYSFLLKYVSMVEAALQADPNLDRTSKLGDCPYTVEQVVTEALRRLGWSLGE